MNINDDLVTYLEDLSCLTLTEDEKKRLKTDLQHILGYMAKISQVDTAGIPERSHPFEVNGVGFVNAFREDEVHTSLDRELILQNAPKKNDKYIIAPKTVEL